MDLLYNITIFVAIIMSLKGLAKQSYSLMCRLAHEIRESSRGGMVLWGL